MKKIQCALLLATLMCAGVSYASTKSIETLPTENISATTPAPTFDPQPNSDFSDWRCWLISDYFCYAK